MDEDDLKSFIEDVIKDMVEAGELEAGEEMEMDGEESEMDMDVEVEDEEEEIMEMDEVSWNEKNNPTRGATKKALDPKKVGQSTSAYAININEEKEEVEELRPGYAVGELNPENNDLLKAISFIGRQAKKAGKSMVDFVQDIQLGKMSDAIGEGEDLNEIEELKKELQEVNLLNAKLLYTNKIFKSKNLSEDKKVKVLKAFDKAATVKEAKVIFETLNEGISSKMTKPSINEVKGSASKATGVAPKAKQPIVENSAFARMQKLAGIIKN